MDASRRYAGGPIALAHNNQNFEDFDPSYDQVHEPQVDTLLIYLPGFKKDQLRVQLTGTGILEVSGQRPVGGDKWIRFMKQFPVSSNCETNRITAKFEAGVLYITQPKLIVPAEKPESTEPETKETEPNKIPENSVVSGTKPVEPTKPGATTGPVEPAKPGPQTKPAEPAKPGPRTKPVEPEKLDNSFGEKPVRADSGPAQGKKVAGESSQGSKTGGGNAAATAALAVERLKKSRKILNVALVVMVVVGVGFYVNYKIKLMSPNEEGEL